MKKVLCDKNGKFLSVHDGDCLTHEDGTIMIYRERKCKKIFLKHFIMFIYEIMNYIFLKLECHFLTMILSHFSDFLQKKKKNVCTTRLPKKACSTIQRANV